MATITTHKPHRYALMKITDNYDYCEESYSSVKEAIASLRGRDVITDYAIDCGGKWYPAEDGFYHIATMY